MSKPHPEREYWYTPNMHQVWEDHDAHEIQETLFSQACANKLHVKLNDTGLVITVINPENNKVLGICATRQFTYKERLK